MSASQPKGDEEPHDQGETGQHGTLRGYLVGFGLSAMLTALPFWLVMGGPFALPVTAVAIFALGMAQIVIHVLFFLHLDTRSEGGWTLMAFVFTAVILAITIAGSIWIMYHLNANMMPMQMPPQDPAAAP